MGSGDDLRRDMDEEPWERASRRRRRQEAARKEARQARREARRQGRHRDGRRPLTPEERAYREARAAASRKVGFVSHAIAWGTVCFFLLAVAGFRVAFIVALAWGIGLASHWFGAMVAPAMRARIIEREVGQRLGAGVSQERRALGTDQARRVEELAAGVAHEIRNPITAAKSLVQQMGEDPGARENVEYASVALAELERVERSISHLLRFAREEEMELSSVKLGEVIQAALDTFRERLDALGVQVEQDLAGPAALRGDAEKLRRVFINLIGNALDAFAEAHTQRPVLRLAVGENLAGTETWARVGDNGPGMEAERLERIWSPFYTSKSGGTGIGLALSKKVVDAHGGEIEAHSTPGQGTEFVLVFPKDPSGEGA